MRDLIRRQLYMCDHKDEGHKESIGKADGCQPSAFFGTP